METTQRGASSCAWAVPTLNLSAPLWLDAWDRPWACLREGEPHPIETTEACATCPRWEPREKDGPAPVAR